MFKKGQAAMEFLMTYGWAILVVLAAIGALAYFGVLNPGQLLPDKCTFPASFDCIDKPVVNFDTGVVQLAVRNDVGYPIDTVGATLTGDGDCETITLTSVTDPTNTSLSSVVELSKNENKVLPSNSDELSYGIFANSRIVGKISIVLH